jgi:nucleotidyltransferase substrate binding protein (TIGR01987 family)
MTFKEVLRLAAEQGLIDSPEAWFVYRKARNETSHGYDEKKAVVVYEQIGPFAKSARVLLDNLIKKNSSL